MVVTLLLSSLFFLSSFISLHLLPFLHPSAKRTTRASPSPSVCTGLYTSHTPCWNAFLSLQLLFILQNPAEGLLLRKLSLTESPWPLSCPLLLQPETAWLTAHLPRRISEFWRIRTGFRIALPSTAQCGCVHRPPDERRKGNDAQASPYRATALSMPPRMNASVNAGLTRYKSAI